MSIGRLEGCHGGSTLPWLSYPRLFSGSSDARFPGSGGMPPFPPRQSRPRHQLFPCGGGAGGIEGSRRQRQLPGGNEGSQSRWKDTCFAGLACSSWPPLGAHPVLPEPALDVGLHVWDGGGQLRAASQGSVALDSEASACAWGACYQRGWAVCPSHPTSFLTRAGQRLLGLLRASALSLQVPRTVPRVEGAGVSNRCSLHYC